MLGYLPRRFIVEDLEAGTVFDHPVVHLAAEDEQNDERDEEQGKKSLSTRPPASIDTDSFGNGHESNEEENNPAPHPARHPARPRLRGAPRDDRRRFLPPGPRQ